MNKIQWRAVLGIAILGVVCACSKATSSTPVQQNAQWLRDGMIAISRPVPNVSHSAAQGLLGFMPISTASHSGAWMSLDISKKTVSVMEGDRAVSVLLGEGLENLKPGTYQLLHKQKNALWYAPDSYFTTRNLKVPAQGDRSRYRRGALGEFVLYLDKDTPIYSGPVWDDEIGGIRLAESEMAKLYNSIDTGSSIEVR